VRARARRLAAASQQRLKTARRHAVRRHPSSTNDDESDESYGEVDEKTVEEGWNVPDVMDAEVCVGGATFNIHTHLKFSSKSQQ